jgi:thioesterase III
VARRGFISGNSADRFVSGLIGAARVHQNGAAESGRRGDVDRLRFVIAITRSWRVSSLVTRMSGIMHHVTEIVVRGYHHDSYGHVNHARVVELLEEARWRLFEERMSRGVLSKDESPVAVVNINVDYKAPAKLYDTLVIDSSVESVGNTSAAFRQVITIKESGAEAVNARVTFVAVDAKTGKPVPIVGKLRELLEGLR